MMRLSDLSRKWLLISFLVTFSPISIGTSMQVVTEHHPPVQYIVEGQIKGLATDIVRALLSETGIDAQFHIVPWARAYDKALNDANTLIFSMARTDLREPHFQWIGPVSQLNVAVLALAGRDYSDVKELDDTRDYLFAVIRDAYSFDYLTEHGFSTEKNVFLAATMQEQVNLLLKGKVDFLLTDPLPVRQRLLNLGYTGEEIMPLMWIDELGKDLFLAASKDTNSEVVEALRKALIKMQPTEFYQTRYNLKAYEGDRKRLPM